MLYSVVPAAISQLIIDTALYNNGTVWQPIRQTNLSGEIEEDGGTGWILIVRS